MANPEHVRIIKLGVAAWNQWRLGEPDVWPDLITAPLRSLSLDGINLENTNLHRADLESTSLIGAKLRNVNLKDAILINANLQGASLRESNLYNADLRDANMEGTDLRDANLSRARFASTRLDRSIFEETGFDSNLLVGATGIDTIFHKEAWSADVGVLQEAARLLTDKPHLHQAAVRFFRNARVPEHLLRDHFATRNITSVWHTCFVSYSHQDREFADLLCNYLEDKRVHYWRDTHSGIPVGSEILSALTRAIVAYDKVLLCCSQSSLTSAWVHEEIGLALEKEEKLQRDVLLPLDIDGFLRTKWMSPYSPLLNRRFIADFVGWREKGGKLTRSLEQVASALRVIH